jgi:hypothetical protein
MNSVTGKRGAGNFQIFLLLSKVFASEIVGFDSGWLSAVDYVKMVLMVILNR